MAVSRVEATPAFDGLVQAVKIDRERSIFYATRGARKRLKDSIVELAIGRMAETEGEGGEFCTPRLVIPEKEHRLGNEATELARAAEFAAQHLHNLNLGLVVFERRIPSDYGKDEISRYARVAPVGSACLELTSPGLVTEGICVVRILFPPQE